MNLTTLVVAKSPRVKPVLMYHGTSSKWLRSIKTHGLVPNPKAKVWDTDKDSLSNRAVRSRASLFGTYLTTNLMTALGSATTAVDKFGGSHLFVVAKIQLLSGKADEDHIRFPIEREFVNSFAGSSYQLNSMWGVMNATSWKDVAQFAKVVHQRLALTKEPLPLQLWLRYVKVEFQMMLAKQSLNRWHIMDGWSRVTDKPFDDSILTLPPLAESEAEYKQVLEKLTTHYRRRPRVHGLRDALGTNIRLTEPVKFKGSNRIVALFTWDGWKGQALPPESKVLQRQWGTVPAETLATWIRVVGPGYEVVK